MRASCLIGIETSIGVASSNALAVVGGGAVGGAWNQLDNFYTQHVGFYCRNTASSGNRLARLNLPLDRRLREPQNLALRLFLSRALSRSRHQRLTRGAAIYFSRATRSFIRSDVSVPTAVGRN